MRQVMWEPLGFDRRSARRGPTMIVEVRISSVFTPDGRPPRMGRCAVHVGRTDCTDRMVAGRARTPSAVQVVMKSALADTEPPSPKFAYVNRRPTSGSGTRSGRDRCRRRDVSV